MSRSLTLEEISGADFRDGQWCALSLSDAGDQIGIMCDSAVLGTDEYPGGTVGINVQLREPIAITERRGTFGLVVEPGYARNLLSIAEFSISADALYLAGPAGGTTPVRVCFSQAETAAVRAGTDSAKLKTTLANPAG